MARNHSIIDYSKRIEHLVNELAAADHTISDLEKKRALLRGLRSKNSVTAQVIRSTGKEYLEAVSEHFHR